MLLSYHVHSKWSDGKSTLLEIVSQAKKLNLDEVGISDHLTLSPYQKELKWSMPLENLDPYILEVEKFSKNFPVKLGLEADFFPETVDELKKIVASRPFDYIIGSVHFVGDKQVDFKKENVSQNEFNELTRNYWELIRQMAKTRVFDIVGHMDLTKEYGLCPDCDLSKEIDLALDAISEADMCVELNTSGWYRPCQQQYPSVELLKGCRSRDIPVIVSADAHLFENLTRDFEKAYLLLKNLGFTKQPYYIKRKRFFSSFPSFSY